MFVVAGAAALKDRIPIFLLLDCVATRCRAFTFKFHEPWVGQRRLHASMKKVSQYISHIHGFASVMLCNFSLTGPQLHSYQDGAFLEWPTETGHVPNPTSMGTLPMFGFRNPRFSIKSLQLHHSHQLGWLAVPAGAHQGYQNILNPNPSYPSCTHSPHV